MKRTIPFILLVVLAAVLAACGGTAAPAPTAVPMPTEVMEEALPSIAEIAAGNEDFSTLVAALSAAGLVDTLAGEGNFTVFAPTNAAFAALPMGTVDALLADPQGDLTQILLYHVVDGVAKAADVVNLSEVTTLNGAPIAIAVDGTVRLNNAATVVTTDIEASNGVIHVIDAVLLPPSDEAMAPTQSIAEIAAGNEDFSTLVAALSAAGLVDTLAGEGNFTVFAPTNAAFDALPMGTVEALLADPEGDLTQILLYHVVDGVAKAADVVNLSEVTTLNGAPVTIAVVDGTVRLNDAATVVATDIEATNGVIHVIDAVLLPPAGDAMAPTQSIAEIAAGNEDFSTLVAALSAAGLVDTLAGEGNFTVFAPTNAAFAALPEGTVEALLEEPEGLLTRILLYHVVDGAAKAEDVANMSGVETLNGATVSIAVVDGQVKLNDSATVTATDIMATNGVIHVIDSVLIPSAGEAGSIADIVAANEDFSTLLAAVSAAGLVETLAGPGDFTVFAPTNEAFAALPAGTIESLLADPQGALTQILLYHVLGERADAAKVVTLSEAETLQGSPITIEIVDGGVVLNGSVMVTQTDIMASNGVIHVINAVLLPPSQ